MAGDQLHAFVEIPKGSRNKYEYDAEIGHVVLDRTLWTSVVYPADYGYLMGTMGRDGDPVDAMILVAEPTFPGCVIPVEPIGVFEMRDEAGDDDKVLCVPVRDPMWSHMHDISDIRGSLARRDRALLRGVQGPGARQGHRGRRLARPRPCRRGRRRRPRRGRWSGVSVRAAVIEGPGRFSVETFPDPDPGPGAVVLRMHYSGICGTDKHTWRGESIQYAGTDHERDAAYPAHLRPRERRRDRGDRARRPAARRARRAARPR